MLTFKLNIKQTNIQQTICYVEKSSIFTLFKSLYKTANHNLKLIGTQQKNINL